MRGQVSLEFIVVIAVFLAVLTIWLTGIDQTQTAISFALGTQQAVITADKISTAINSVCVMGDGNQIELTINVIGTIHYDNGFVMQWGNRSFERKTYCEFNDFELKQTISLENNDQFIYIT